jgi:hypothetical protein
MKRSLDVKEETIAFPERPGPSSLGRSFLLGRSRASAFMGIHDALNPRGISRRKLLSMAEPYSPSQLAVS